MRADTKSEVMFAVPFWEAGKHAGVSRLMQKSRQEVWQPRQ